MDNEDMDKEVNKYGENNIGKKVRMNRETINMDMNTDRYGKE